MNGATVRIEFAPAEMTRELAAYYISRSVRDLDILREQKKITPVGEGKRVFYRKSDLDAFVAAEPERKATRGQGE